MPGPATDNMVWRELVIAGGDLIEPKTARREKIFSLNPTANRVPRGKEVLMSAINQYLHHQADLIPNGVRTGALVVAAGISTGSVVYLLSILVGSWG